jgi:hypothetical protein
LLQLGNQIQPPGSSEILGLDSVFLQLTDDMFLNGFPSVESSSPGKLRAFQAFGCLTASLVVKGESLPVQVDEEVLEYIFGLRSETREDIRAQMDAMRSGVYKVEMAKPSLKRIVRHDAFCKIAKFGPASAVEVSKPRDFCKFLLGNFMVLPYLTAKMSESGGRNAVGVMLGEEMRIDYSAFLNLVTLPSLEVWLRAFCPE